MNARLHRAQKSRTGVLRTDLPASLVVFLVALPLCVGVAVASGVPAELGLITGIVGGLVTGLLPGSSLQVSGPAAGLTVLVAEAVDRHGLAGLGAIVLLTGLLQVALGVARLGRWFRAISIAVVEGMLAGIGLIIIAGQLYAMTGHRAPASGLGKLTGLPRLALDLPGDAVAVQTVAIGVAALAVLLIWPRMPARVRAVPGALVAVVGAAAVTALADLPVARVRIGSLWSAVDPIGAEVFTTWGSVAVLGTVVAFTLVASAESLFSAAAVDRLHAGPRTRYDRELVAQGVGNAVCGLLGALPMTAVIVRSAANVTAGARTKCSRVLHGVWLLVFAALVPGVLGMIPLAALAAVLLHAGWKLLPLRHLGPLWADHRGEVVVLLTTAVAIVTTSMFEGVLIGLAAAVAKAAWEASALHLHVSEDAPGPITVRIEGTATFLRLPRILDTLEALPPQRPVQLDLARMLYRDHAVQTALATWSERHNSGVPRGVLVGAEGVEPPTSAL